MKSIDITFFSKDIVGGSLFLGMSGMGLPCKNQKSYPAELEGKSRIVVCGTIFNTIKMLL
ncbi:hypothetical protein [Dyadobacter sp. CY312]|uniref:hypothetical protein n=1 Tax=Dyadobacter sp. CY312 TaxID=2907303 RepID=UPI001F47F571|nr:hypothetical protein [Dyadobacter sp. CY312]MCE7042884.1 hypothetical protein [Dyadobacter sp. CY312]